MAHYKKVVLKSVDEWLTVRQPLVGGSEISSVIGINPWESKYELYLRKRGAVEPKVENLAMRLGHKLENSVAELLCEEQGYQVIKNTAGNVIYLSEDYPFAEASPDRIAYLPNARHTESNKCIVEIKTTQKQVDPDNIPEHWICQVTWYMGITGIHNAVIAWLTAGRDFGFAEIPFDADFFRFLTEEGAQFARDVAEGNEPEAITARDIDKRYPYSESGAENEVSEEVALACEEYKVIKEEIKVKEARKDELEEIIKVSFGSAESISYSGLRLATYKSSKDRPRFDKDRFVEENPELAAKYTNIVPGSRRLSVK